MGFYEDMEKSLLEAIAMERDDIPISERKDTTVPTFIASNATFMKKRSSQEDVRLKRE